MKIRIIGCSGSGKSYLARGLSQKLGIEAYDLDDIQWDNTQNTYGIKMPKEKRAALLAEILAKESWIIEGVYHSWVQDSFTDADVIYLIEMPKRLYKARIIRRFIRRKLGIEKGKKESLGSLLALLKWTDKFMSENMKEIDELLTPLADKVVRLKKKKEVMAILK